MSLRGVKYIGPFFDSSGYASATRNYVLALHRVGVPITLDPHCFENNQPPIGTKEERALLTSLVGKNIEYDTVIAQLTPDMAIMHREGDKYNISYFAWESSVVHPKWVECLNTMDEVWVPSVWNVDSLKNSGVVVPVFNIPHGIDVDRFKNVDKSCLEIPGIGDSTYKFYNIFQWNERKNPESLIRSYFNAFQADEDVVLILKTYVFRGDVNEQGMIAEKVRGIKKDMGLKRYPRVVLVPGMLSDEQVSSLHLRGDCFISLHHSEGWGLTPFEAGAFGNPVICTGATGNMEFMTEENSYPVKFQWEYVKGMSTFNPWYLGTGTWAAPDEMHAASLMRYVFDNRDEAKSKGALLRKDISEKYNWGIVANKMVDRIKNKKRLPLSLLIIAKNEEDSIGGCIDSVADYVKDIVVLDTGSTDSTIDIAESLGASVYRVDMADFATLANHGISLTEQDIVLVLDCDERLIKQELLEKHVFAILDEEYDAVALPRSRWSDWHMLKQVEKDAYPDWQVRLFRKSPSSGYRRAFPHVEFHGVSVKHFEVSELPEVAHFCDMFPERRKIRYKQNLSHAKKGGINYFFSECSRQERFRCPNHPFLDHVGCELCGNYKALIKEFISCECLDDCKRLAIEYGISDKVFEEWLRIYEEV